MTNILIESYFKSLKLRQLKGSTCTKLDHGLHIVKENMVQSYVCRLFNWLITLTILQISIILSLLGRLRC